jgi:hypothetical protein
MNTSRTAAILTSPPAPDPRLGQQQDSVSDAGQFDYIMVGSGAGGVVDNTGAVIRREVVPARQPNHANPCGTRLGAITPTAPAGWVGQTTRGPWPIRGSGSGSGSGACEPSDRRRFDLPPRSPVSSSPLAFTWLGRKSATRSFPTSPSRPACRAGWARSQLPALICRDSQRGL